jgi:hypothetical protein
LLKDFNILVLKFSSLLELLLLLSSLLVGLVPLGWIVVEGDGVGKDSVVLVVAVGIVDVGVVFVSAADGRSLIHTAPETKWYPVGHIPPGSGRSTIGILVVVVVVTPVILSLPVLLANCANGAADGEEFIVCCVVADDNKGDFTVLEMPHMRASVVLTTLRSGLLRSHIFALISGDILLDELVVDSGDDDADNVGEDDCWAYAWILLQIAKTSIPPTTENIVKSNLE